MPVQLNHTIVHAHDSLASATFLTELFELDPPTWFAPFWVVQVDNAVSLDYIDVRDFEFVPQHYAFLVSETEFDEIFGRITSRGMPHWADPAKKIHDEINHHFGGRGVYFQDPNAHFLEIITQPYGNDS